jgi:hypothetical protein
MGPNPDSFVELAAAINGFRPDLGVTIRRSIAGGLSGASIYLTECQLEGEQRLAVLKLASAGQAEAEVKGDGAARESWLGGYLPDRLLPLGELPGQKKLALLSPLAQHRLEDCQTLEEILRATFGYGADHVLFALGFAYRQQARAEWAGAELRSVRDYFADPIRPGLGEAWLGRWRESGLPGPEYPTVVFDDVPERWPNPVAFLLDESAWKQHSQSARIPWVVNHGDLNSRNVLAPSYLRAASQQLIGSPVRLLPNLRLIDMPFCRPAPYTYDPAFLASALRTQLPRLDSRARRDLVVATYRAALEGVATGQQPANVPLEGQHYVRCLYILWGQVRLAQEKMVADIEAAFLASLAAASLWQAVKAVNRQRPEDRDRLAAVSSLVFSALALHQLLGAKARLPGPDFSLWTDPQAVPSTAWTEAAKAVARRVEEAAAGHRSLILVCGRDWGPLIGLPPEVDLPALKNRAPSELQEVLEQEPSPPALTRLGTLGKLPLLAVLDWSVFRYPRDAVRQGLQSGRHLVPLAPGQKPDPDWSDRKALFYIHLRGRLEELPTVALAAPERNAARRKLREPLERFAKKRGQNLIVFYVGLSETDLPETHEFLQDVWSNKLRATFVGPAPSAADYLREWNIDVVPGTIEDFLTAVSDFAQTAPEGEATNDRARILLVADMARDAGGELVSSPGQTLSVMVPEEDYQAIGRAGHLLLAGDRERLARPDRNPREFLIGHRVTLAEIHAGVPVERDHFALYLEYLGPILKEQKRPRLLVLPARPGAGASTALRWLAYRTAYDLRVPTLVLGTGGNAAFEAIQRLHALVGRSFLVVGDPEDVPVDDQQGILSRFGPPRYPVLFLTSRRVYQKKDPGQTEVPLLQVELSDGEKSALLQRLHQYCPGLSLGRLMDPSARSLFLLILEAFGGENVRVDTFVQNVLSGASEVQRLLVAAIAFFSRYAHRSCSEEFLQILTGTHEEALQGDLEAFDQLLVIHENDGWSCRHEELTRVVLQYHLTGRTGPGDSWRFQLADWTCQLIDRCDGALPGGDIAAEYFWAILNPQQEAVWSVSGQRSSICRLMQGDDGIPENPMRDRVYRKATEQFPEHVNIVSHYGKFLSEVEGKYAEADRYLEQARQLEPKNEAILHMLGKRYYDEVRQVMRAYPPKNRPADVQERVDALAQAAHHWFDQAHQESLGSEYTYATPIQLDIELIEDEFRRLGIQSAANQPDALLRERIASLLTHADSLVADGLLYITPENRSFFRLVRDRLLQLRGDLDSAIRSFERHVAVLSGAHRATAQVQLTRFLLERGERLWEEGKRNKALRDFEKGQAYVWQVMQDPARQFDNIKLWYQCARYMQAWRRQDLLDRLLQLHERKASLDSAFLLMCLYFADAVETGSLPSWRRYEQFQKESDRLSAPLPRRTYIREWLVDVEVRGGRELRIFPHHILAKDESEDNTVDPEAPGECRVRVPGAISRVLGPTKADLKIEPMGFSLFFKPRVKDRVFYPSDVGQRVTCAVAFTYEKPIGYDVRKRAK